MPVRLGGSYVLDPDTGELTPNIPADEVGDPNTPRAIEPGPDGDTAIGAQGETIADAATTAAVDDTSPRRKAAKKDD